MTDGEQITKINISEQMKSAYIDYSMSVIVSRALPEVRDGLKPVHRRVLFGMNELGLTADKPYKKSARIVGEVLGKYHPHGDSSVYFTMVRMAQSWSMRYKLVDGQGNFGSIDGDSPAAMRYTEARLSKIAMETLRDLDRAIVDYQLNFDDTLEEPTVLPTRIPNLLVNGASGIAVGMATNIPPHNLNETIDATIAYINNRDISIEELMEHVNGPDFPTGGTIYGHEGVKNAYKTGKGRVVLRGRTHIETSKSGKSRIIITELPYMVNKAELIQKVGDLVNEKRLPDITLANDESDKNGMRIVFELKREAVPNVVINKLYKYTQLQTSIGVNSIALVNGRPRLLTLKDIIHYFVEHRHDIVYRRAQRDLKKAEEQAHIKEGLIIALDHIDEIVDLIKKAKNPQIAKEQLINNYELTDRQAQAILNMRLQTLTGFEQDQLRKEYEELLENIKYLNQFLADESMRMEKIKEELLEIKENYGDTRNTDITYASEEFNPEDFYGKEDVVITISHMGYIKRTPVKEFRTQNRGGTGAKGSTMRDEDFIRHIYIANMHHTMLFFTSKGKCYWLKVYEIPEGSKASRGRAIQNMLNIGTDDRVQAYIRVKTLKDQEYINNHFIIMITRNGIIKKTLLSAYSRPRQNGIQAINIKDNDRVLDARLTAGNSDIIIGSKFGKAIRFNETNVRPMGRTTSGVRGIHITHSDDRVVGMVSIANKEEDVLVVSEKGYGKRSKVDDYRLISRGGKGAKTMNISEKTGNLAAILGVKDAEDLMIINRSGLIIRLAVSSLRRLGRAARGVRLVNLKKKDSIASVASVKEENGKENNDNESPREAIQEF